MNVYAICYELNRPGQSYKDLHEAIAGLGAWWHQLHSTWLVKTDKSAKDIVRILREGDRMAPNDRLLVIRVDGDYQGWLPKEAWEWIRKAIPPAPAARAE